MVIKEHIKRLESEESNLNTLIFENSDGTRTMYLYSYPVKYVDEDGITKDIGLDIISSAQNDGTYLTKQNDIKTATQ